MKEIAGDGIEPQAKEITNLRASDENRYAVGEADDNRAGKIFDGGAHTGDAEEQRQNPGHHGANEKAVHTMLVHDASYDDDESTSGASDLRLGTAEKRNEEAGDNRAVDAGLRREL